MNKIKITEDVFYIGCQDWDKRDFHGYNTPRGVTYNSYLIMDEKICLVDLVKDVFAKEYLEKIKSVVPLDKVDCIVMNHVENDHASALPYLLQYLKKDIEIYISAAGATEAKKLYGDYNYVIVKDSDIIDLGKKQLKVITLPMLHWPDSMATYLESEKILFSNDALGQHYCASKIFDDENDIVDVLYEAKKYYANILMPYSKLILPALKKIQNLSLDMICPSHGVVWRSHISDIVASYEKWGQGCKEDKILVVYDTMWGATEKMARAVYEGVSKAGTKAKLFKLSVMENSVLAEEMLDASGVILGSPTLNLSMMPTMGKFLVYLKGLKPADKHAATFGAYGWSGGSQKDMEEFILKAGMNLHDGLFVKWAADEDEIEKYEQFGYDFATKIKI